MDKLSKDDKATIKIIVHYLTRALEAVNQLSKNGFSVFTLTMIRNGSPRLEGLISDLKKLSK